MNTLEVHGDERFHTQQAGSLSSQVTTESDHSLHNQWRLVMSLPIDTRNRHRRYGLGFLGLSTLDYPEPKRLHRQSRWCAHAPYRAQ